MDYDAPLTPGEYIDQILHNVGGPDVLTPEQVVLAWRLHVGKTPNELRYNYALISAIEDLLGMTWQEYDSQTGGGNRMDAGDRFDHLLAMCKRADARITQIEELLTRSDEYGQPAYGEMTRKYPLQTTDGYFPDPNSTAYLGDPIWAARNGS